MNKFLTLIQLRNLQVNLYLPLPALEEKNYSATEVGQMLGISANKVGIIANELKIKTNEYGKWYVDKARYSNKEVNSFRYNQKGIDTIKERLNKIV